MPASVESVLDQLSEELSHVEGDVSIAIGVCSNTGVIIVGNATAADVLSVITSFAFLSHNFAQVCDCDKCKKSIPILKELGEILAFRMSERKSDA
jgi:hypothetical protein